MIDKPGLLENILNNVFESILVVVQIFDENGNLIDYVVSDANSKACSFFGLKKDDLIGKNLSFLFFSIFNMNAESYEGTRNSLFRDNVECILTPRNNTGYDVKIRCSVIEESSFALFFNTSVNLKAELENGKNVDRLKTILNTLYVGVYEVDISSINSYLKKFNHVSSDRLRYFLKRHKKFLISMIQSLRLLDTNPYGLQIFEANSIDHINNNLQDTFTSEFLNFFLNLIIFVKDGKPKLDSYLKINNFKKETLHLLARVKRPESDSLRDTVIICLTNISPLKKVEEELKAQKEQLMASYEQLEAYYEELNATEEELRQSHEELNSMYECLKQNEERLKLALISAEETLWDYDITERKIHFHESWEYFWGYDVDKIGKGIDNWVEFIHPEDTEEFLSTVRKCKDGDQKQFEKEFRIRKPDGKWCWIYSKGRIVKYDDEGKPSRLIGTNRNISQRKDTEERLEYLNSYDSLTGLPNYLLVKNKVEQEIKHSINYETGFAMLFLDLDRFKFINESLGHSVADQLLKMIGKRLAGSVRKNDMVGRITSDEFVVLLNSIDDLENASKTSLKIQKALSEPFIIGEKEVFITASIGIVIFPEDGIEFDALVKNGETAVDSAKKAGKNNFKFYSSKMNSKTFEHFKLENDLHKAIKNEEFVMYYQPQFDTCNCRLLGAEALIRWNHPEKGMISPGEFIPLAEETGLIVTMGNWILEKSLRQLQHWNEKDEDFKLSINISSLQFLQEEFEDNVIDILNRTKVSPKNVYFELTESIMISNVHHILNRISRFKSMGIKFSIDDFGTGYSSLSYLQKFPIDQIKIDRSFIKDISSDCFEAPIVKTIISLADNLKLELIAEGIENDTQKEFLMNHNCHSMQGYLFGKPSPSTDFDKFFKAGLTVI